MTGPGCGCICGGASHRAGKRQAMRNTRRDTDAWVHAVTLANPSIAAVSIFPGARALARDGGEEAGT